MIASVTAYVPKDIVLLNDRKAMIEFEREVLIEILKRAVVYIKEMDGCFRCEGTMLLAYTWPN